MKTNKLTKAKVKSAQKEIEGSLIAELTTVAGKLGKGSKNDLFALRQRTP